MSDITDDLIALAERVEAASEPCREIDCDIAVTLHGGEIVWKQANGTMEMYPARRHASSNHVGGFSNAPVESYTASIDAAMQLVPGSDRAWNVRIERGDDTWGAAVWHPLDSTPDIGPQFISAALALTAASLRARAAA